MTLISLWLFVTLLVPAVVPGQRSGSTIPNQKIFEAIGARPGATVCEMGAGDGDLSIEVAKIVGNSGRVYTSELGEDRVKALRERAEASGLRQIMVMAGDALKTNFPAGACDALFMRNVYHHFADPAAINASILTSLAPGGRVAVVDFMPTGKEASAPAERGRNGTHGVMPETVARELQDAGLEVVASEQGDARWFMVVARRASQ